MLRYSTCSIIPNSRSPASVWDLASVSSIIKPAFPALFSLLCDLRTEWSNNHSVSGAVHSFQVCRATTPPIASTAGSVPNPDRLCRIQGTSSMTGMTGIHHIERTNVLQGNATTGLDFHIH